MKIKEFGSHIVEMHADGFEDEIMDTDFSKKGLAEFHRAHPDKYLFVILIGQIDGDQIIHTFDMSGTFPTDESGLMTRYPSTGAYFDIGTGWDGREVSYERVVDATIWVHNVFDYINLFENGVDLRKLYEEDKLYETN